jgi:mannosyltransferase OCH1-like enzyme
MSIPRIVHQLWKNETIPARWQDAVRSVQRYHKGWDYRLWTDELMDRHVRVNHPAFYKAFAGMNRHIMRVDVFRYVLMNDFGGLYCDLDYEFLRPFDYSRDDVVLSLEYDVAYGDEHDQIANYVFASVPGHQLWKDLMTSIATNPPHTPSPADVCIATGPWFVTQVYNANASRYTGVRLTPKPVLSPRRVHGRYERKIYVNSGITYGFHYGWGSWRERMNLAHLKRRLLKLFGVKLPPERAAPLVS